jgi:hypothetical protein
VVRDAGVVPTVSAPPRLAGTRGRREGMGKEVLHPGCNYYAMPDSVCNKCGKYIPPTPPVAEAGKVEALSAEEIERERQIQAEVIQPDRRRLRLLATLDAKDREIERLKIDNEFHPYVVAFRERAEAAERRVGELERELKAINDRAYHLSRCLSWSRENKSE